MNRSERFYTDEAVFLRSVAEERLKRKSLGILWLKAAISSWPSAASDLVSDAVIRKDINMENLDVISLNGRSRKAKSSNIVGMSTLAGLGMIIAPLAFAATVGAGIYMARNIWGDDDNGKEAIKRISNKLQRAKRAFFALQASREFDRQSFKEEIERLFEELVN